MKIDYGVQQGYKVEPGTEAPLTSVSVLNKSGEEFTVERNILYNDYNNYFQNAKTPAPKQLDDQVLGRGYFKAQSVLQTAGMSAVPNSESTQVGYDAKGTPLFSANDLKDNQDASLGIGYTKITDGYLDALGMFEDFDAQESYNAIGNASADPSLHQALGTARASQSFSDFQQTLNNASRMSGDDAGYIAYKMYENWPVMSPAQRSLALAAGFSSTYADKSGRLLSDRHAAVGTAGNPNMTVSEGISMLSEGLNASFAANQWGQVTALQNTMFTPRRASDIVETGTDLDALGIGKQGRSVPITDEVYDNIQASPQPQYGVGAITVPQQNNTPDGYVIAGQENGYKILVPEKTFSTSYIQNPISSMQGARSIYGQWDGEGTVEYRGEKGGVNLIGTLNELPKINPHSASMMFLQESPAFADPKATDMQILSSWAGTSLASLLDGKSPSALGGKVSNAMNPKMLEDLMAGATPKEKFSPENYNFAMERLRRIYAENGIMSLEQGMYLANQGYAENRFNDTQTASIYQALKMVFTPGSTDLGEKMLLGKVAGRYQWEKMQAWINDNKGVSNL